MIETSRRSILAAGAALPVAALAQPAPFGSVKRLSPRLDELIAPEAKVERVCGGTKWAEGPVWVKRGRYLLFSDPPMNTMYRWGTGGMSPFLHPSGYSGPLMSQLREAGTNGLAIDAHGKLIACDSGDRAIVKIDLKTKRRTTVVERYDGKRFNSPNDLCIAKSGAIYFTDPPYGLVGVEHSPVKEMPYSGVFRWGPDGSIVLLDETMLYPNGIALSPDESTLYVSNTDTKMPIIRAYPLGLDGYPSGSSTTFFDSAPLIKPGVQGRPDGMKVDVFGNVFAAGPGGILVISKEGELLGVIATGRAMPNCAFGEDGHTLFMAATDSIARIRLKTKGAV